MEITNTGNREVITTHVFDFPRELVFKAWTDPNHLAQWWGPNGFTNTFHEFDLRPGGSWRFVMHSPTGTDYQNESVFVEVAKPERLVFIHISAPKFQTTATFVEKDGKTKLTWRMFFESAAQYEKIKAIVTEGNKQNIERLEKHLAEM